MTEPISELVTAGRLVSSPAVLPKKYLDSLVSKWRTLINGMLKKNREIRVLHTQLDTDGFTNKYGVKFCMTHFSYYRETKKFVIVVAPKTRQDILCIRRPDKEEPYVRVEEISLRLLFTKFFAQLNQVRFCSSCGNFCLDDSFYPEHELCESCLFEELACESRSEVHVCTICQEDMKRWYKTDCGHYFHRKCLASLKPSNGYLRCPNCRSALDPGDQAFSESHGEDQ